MHSWLAATAARRACSRLAAPLRAAFGVALDVALPPLCPACREPVGRRRPVRRLLVEAVASSRRPIASGSASRSPTTPAPACCRWRRSPIRRPITAPAPRCATTTSPARWCMRSNTATGSTSRRPLGRWMARAGRELLADADALVPVPLHWRRLWARRFNQSALLAKAIAADHRRAGRARRAQARQGDGAAGRPLAEASAPAMCRARSGCRRRPGRRSPGRRLVLVDDVLTSGATADACARGLLRAGAGNVDVLVFARVVDAVASAHIVTVRIGRLQFRVT